MVKLNKIYTKGGDAGETSLGDGSRVPKSALRVEAYGTVDETNATLGLARLNADAEVDALLNRIQNDLFDLGADLCRPIAPDEGRALRIVQSQVDWLEAEIDRINADLPELTSFVLPAGSATSSHLHLARTICRRAERLVSALAAAEPINQLSLIYLNRLSDLLFVLARHANGGASGDVLWVPGASR